MFDPLGFLPGSVVEEIAEPLLKVRANDQVDVVVVIVPDFEDASPEDVARQFSDAWCDPHANCIVLYAPGREDGPWIVPGGTLIKVVNSRNFARDVLAAQRRAALEPEPSGKIRAASVEAADLLRYAKGQTVLQGEILQKTWMERLQERRAQILRYKLLGLSAAALALPLLAGLILLFALIHKRRPRRFPHIQTQQRLGAPYGGGNSVITDLGSPPH